MSVPKPNQVTVRDLVEEAKKRIVILVVCVVGLSYLMSLTSSSVWINLPAAASLIIVCRYLALDYEMKRKAASYNSKGGSTSIQSSKKLIENPNVVAKFEWREKVNSPVVEDAIDHFTRHLISEWVTDLWYSRLTPDKEGPEELVQLINGVIGEISGRMRNINLIDFLMRDLISLICTHLELFRAAHSKVEKQQTGSLTIESRDTELKIVLAAEDKLHPALFSSEAEHKVLQHLMNGLMSVTFKSEDLQCSFFRYTARELLACAVMRPVLNLANPRFINERIEAVVISKTKVNKGVDAAKEVSHTKAEESQTSSDHFSKCLDPSATGVELMQLKNGQPRKAGPSAEINVAKDPLLSIDAQSSRSWNSMPANSQTNGDQVVQRHHSGGEWGDILDVISQRKTQALAPEHFENVWAKGKNYKKRDGENQSNEHVPRHPTMGKSSKVDNMKAISGPKEKYNNLKLNPAKGGRINSGYSSQFTVENASFHADKNGSTCSSVTSSKDDEQNHINMHMSESESNTSYTSEDDETSAVTGLDSPGTKVWDGRSNRKQAVSYVHHPLENFDNHGKKKRNKSRSRYAGLSRTQSGSKRSRPSARKIHMWQEVERSSFLSGDGQDILSSTKSHVNSEESSDDADNESLGRAYSGAAASSSYSISKTESFSLAVNPLKSSSTVDSFYKLRCEVLGANIVKSGSRTFAVYCISVTDVNNNSWSIKRRFRHFEELHRRLKEFPEYNLHLPPKHFLSPGLDVQVIQERCELLDKYLKKLMQLPTVSESIEVWDFLSVDSQTYIFSNSFSIVETLSVGLDAKPTDKTKSSSNASAPESDPFAFRRENGSSESKVAVLQTRNNVVADGLRPKVNGMPLSLATKKNTQESRQSFDNSGINSDNLAWKNAPSPNNFQKSLKGRDSLDEVSDVHHCTADTIPTEWVPPNLSVPILDLVDVIFNLQDGGWIRRKAFWVAKQVLQLGMGDAFDDWLIEKIQLLRKGSVIASGVGRVEQILWPDGIFLTKHPNRRPPPPTSPSHSSPHGHQPTPVSSPRMDDEQQQEADRRAKFVYELMIDHAPPAIVGLVGRKEYEQCARDLYFFLQSSVCLKQLSFDILELLLLSAFPELDDVFKQLHEEKHRFGEFKTE